MKKLSTKSRGTQPSKRVWTIVVALSAGVLVICVLLFVFSAERASATADSGRAAETGRSTDALEVRRGRIQENRTPLVSTIELNIDAAELLKNALEKKRSAPIMKTRQTWLTKRGTKVTKNLIRNKTPDGDFTLVEFIGEGANSVMTFTQLETPEGLYHQQGNRVFLLPRSLMSDEISKVTDSVLSFLEHDPETAANTEAISSRKTLRAFEVAGDKSKTLISERTSGLDSGFVEKYLEYSGRRKSGSPLKNVDASAFGRSRETLYILDTQDSSLRATLKTGGSRETYEEIFFPASLTQQEQNSLQPPAIAKAVIVNSRTELAIAASRLLLPSSKIKEKQQPKK